MIERRKTAEELMGELSADPEYRARVKAQEEARQQYRGALDSAAGPLVTALRSAGLNVKTLWDLLDGRKLPAAAISVLLDHVKREHYPDQVKEGMLRALGSPEARSHWADLVEIFGSNTANLSSSIRYVAAVALDGAADDSVIEDVLRLVKDRSLGFDRAPLLLTLKRSRDPRAKALLLELRDDPDLGSEVKKMRRLGKR